MRLTSFCRSGPEPACLYLVRWFWWRVNAWCEVAAMASSFLMSLLLLVLAKNGIHLSTARSLLATIAFTTVCWLITAYVAPATDRRVLVDFYLEDPSEWAGLGTDSHRSARRQEQRRRLARQHSTRDAGMGGRVRDGVVVSLQRR